MARLDEERWAYQRERFLTGEDSVWIAPEVLHEWHEPMLRPGWLELACTLIPPVGPEDHPVGDVLKVRAPDGRLVIFKVEGPCGCSGVAGLGRDGDEPCWIARWPD